MIKIKVLKNYKDYKESSTYVINENEAHTLIDKGYAEIYKNKVVTNYSNKMMRTKNKKGNYERYI